MSEYKRVIGSDEAACNLLRVTSSQSQASSLFMPALSEKNVANHRLRQLKLANYSEHVGVSGQAEYAVHYGQQFDPKNYVRRVRRAHTLASKLPFQGRSEYRESFTEAPFRTQNALVRHFKYTMNPEQSVDSAIYPRRLAQITPLQSAQSETRQACQWPGLENREKFEWNHLRLLRK